MLVRHFILAVCSLAMLPAPHIFAQTDAGKPLSHIAFGSCANQDKECPIWDSIGKTKPELLVLLGDTIYADLDKSKKVTGEFIRSKYDKLDALPAFAALKKSVPMMATWDDHDYGKNDAGAEWVLKDDAQKVFLDFFGVPADSPRRTQKGVYNAQLFGPVGKRVQVIMLDGRYFRSEVQRGKFDPRTRITPSIPNNDPGATFLGEEQWKWFEEQLKVPADLRLIGSGIQLLCDEHPFEKWALIPKERERFFQLLRSTKANGVVVLSGDRHLAELSVSTDAISYPLYDITSSGFNQANKAWRAPEKNKYRVATMPFGNNFGMIHIDWASETSPRVTLELRDEDGEIVVRHPIRLAMLTPNDKAPGKAKPAEPAKAVELPAGVLTPAEAFQKQKGDEVTVQFEVRGGRMTADKKRLFLNSDADFKSEQNFTVVVNAKARNDKFKDATGDTFRGKIVRVKGKLSEYQKKLQIEIDDEKQLEVVE